MKQIIYTVLVLFCSFSLAACVVVEKDDSRTSTRTTPRSWSP